jgi:hypothetical protein
MEKTLIITFKKIPIREKNLQKKIQYSSVHTCIYIEVENPEEEEEDHKKKQGEK